jgi:hypothetical protein
MEKSRRRREAAGKVPRRRKSVIESGHRLMAASASSSQDRQSNTHPTTNSYQEISNGTAAGTAETHDDGHAHSNEQQRLPWALHVLQTASVHPLPIQSQGAPASLEAGGTSLHLPPNGASDRESGSREWHGRSLLMILVM